jgi:hypothetical protein
VSEPAPAVPEPAAKPEPIAAAAPPPPPVERKSANGKSLAAKEDELMQALERLSKSRTSDLSKPTPQEDEHTQFYRRSDEVRRQEGDKVHCLQRLDGELPETRYVVTPAGLKIGRTAPADVIVPGSAVSRAHCLVEMAADKVRVTDLNSTNGTYVDNKRIERSEILAVGSVLRVGNVSFEHEVLTRAEFELLSDPLNFDNDAAPREARLAR